MGTVCHLCGYVATTITHTFKNQKTGQWRHYCTEHVNQADKDFIHLPFPDEVSGEDPHKYSGLCKVCKTIGHDKCLGYWPQKAHSW
jgi:hypothetical protein